MTSQIWYGILWLLTFKCAEPSYVRLKLVICWQNSCYMARYCSCAHLRFVYKIKLINTIKLYLEWEKKIRKLFSWFIWILTSLFPSLFLLFKNSLQLIEIINEIIKLVRTMKQTQYSHDSIRYIMPCTMRPVLMRQCLWTVCPFEFCVSLQQWFNINVILLTAHNWQKWTSRFLTCPSHKIYRENAVGQKNSNNTFCKDVKVGQIHENFDILSITV